MSNKLAVTVFYEEINMRENCEKISHAADDIGYSI